MDLSHVEQLLEILIGEIRELNGEMRKLKVDVENINDELNWWDKDKHSFAKQILSSLDGIKK